MKKILSTLLAVALVSAPFTTAFAAVTEGDAETAPTLNVRIRELDDSAYTKYKKAYIDDSGEENVATTLPEGCSLYELAIDFLDMRDDLKHSASNPANCMKLTDSSVYLYVNGYASIKETIKMDAIWEDYGVADAYCALSNTMNKEDGTRADPINRPCISFIPGTGVSPDDYFPKSAAEAKLDVKRQVAGEDTADTADDKYVYDLENALVAWFVVEDETPVEFTDFRFDFKTSKGKKNDAGASILDDTTKSYWVQKDTLTGKTMGTATPDTTPVTGVTLDKSTLSLEVGDTATLTATVEPSDATDTSVTWSSDNTDVATVDQTGKVTAKAAGTANITVTTTDGSKTATCAVTVTAPAPQGPTASADTAFVKADQNLGGQATVYSNVTVNPTNANNLNVKITKGDKTQTYNIPLEFDVETSFIAIVKTRVAGTYTLKICDGDDVLATAPSFEVTDADLQ